MKYILLTSFISLFSFAQDRQIVLSVWNTVGTLKVTPGLISAGIELGLKQINSKIEIVNIDTDGSYDDVTSKLLVNIKKYKPMAIIGAITSNMALFISSVAEKEKIPFITPFATLPELTKDKKYTFRTCWNDNQQSQAIVNLVSKDQKLKKGVIIFNGLHSYSIGLKKLFIKNSKKSELNIINSFEITKATDITSELMKTIKALDVDFIFLPTYQTQAATIIKKLAPKLGGKVNYFGGDSWGGGRLFHEMVATLDIKFNGFYTQHYSLESKSSANQDFKKALKKHKILERFNGVKKMTTTAMRSPIAVGYDLIRFLDLAIKSSQNDLVNSIKKVDYDGATGRVKINASNGPSSKSLFIYKIDNNGEKFYRDIL
jgi:branched-chain amino acid transport system substrate-binding protein